MFKDDIVGVKSCDEDAFVTGFTLRACVWIQELRSVKSAGCHSCLLQKVQWLTPVNEVQDYFVQLEVKIGRFGANSSDSNKLAKWDAV